ncbi:hypothetical protein BC826DRAFT_990126 [Russula brevipes]|nr:hypothetical protein BC826DRAFT_990126 [Russula brevipes]
MLDWLRLDWRVPVAGVVMAVLAGCRRLHSFDNGAVCTHILLPRASYRASQRVTNVPFHTYTSPTLISPALCPLWSRT